VVDFFGFVAEACQGHGPYQVILGIGHGPVWLDFRIKTFAGEALGEYRRSVKRRIRAN
jgi:hypothetical protein